MRYLLLVLLLASTAYVSQAQNGEMDRAKIDSKFGFRDVKLESPLSLFAKKQLVKIEEQPNTKYYKSKIENLKLGDYALKDITYVFFKDTLAEIMIQTKGYINSDGLLKIIKETYGQGFQSNRYIERYLWSGDKSTIYYDQNSVTHDALLTISSTAMMLKMQESETERNKKTGNSDF